VPFTNPLVAGNTLIREAIQSPDYVAGVSGWTINKDGTAEFNSVVVRGVLDVKGPDNSEVEVITGGPTRVGAHIEIRANDFSPALPVLSAAITKAYIDAFTQTVSAGEHRIDTEFFGGSFNGSNFPGIKFYSAPYEGGSTTYIDLANSTNDGNMNLTVYGLTSLVYGAEVYGTFTVHTQTVGLPYGGTASIVDDNGHHYVRGESGRFNQTYTAVSNFSRTITFAHTFDTIPVVMTNMESTAGGTLGFITRAWSVSVTGFTFFAQNANNTAMTGTNIPFSWVAYEPG
jgi:hypothetical protein